MDEYVDCGRVAELIQRPKQMAPATTALELTDNT